MNPPWCSARTTLETKVWETEGCEKRNKRLWGLSSHRWVAVVVVGVGEGGVRKDLNLISFSRERFYGALGTVS